MPLSSRHPGTVLSSAPARPHGLVPHTAARALQMAHLLSLDAPAVAALWTWFIARACRTLLRSPSILAMFIAVWIIYAADRLLDARLLGVRLLDKRPLEDPTGHSDLEERHFFHYRHRRSFRAIGVVALIVLPFLVPSLPARSIHLYLALGGILLGYFVMIHLNGGRVGPPAKALRIPKELAVGALFSAATFIPTVAGRREMYLPLLPAAVLFAIILSINCLFIYIWEHPAPAPQTHPFTLLATRFLPHLASTAGCVCILCVVLAAVSESRLSPWQVPLAGALSCGLLLALHRFRRRFAPTTLRAAADLCLLTPLLLIPFLNR